MISQYSTLEISLGRLGANVELFRKRLGRTEICATVKADAYGHGARIVVPALRGLGVNWFGVYSLAEAVQVAGIAREARVLVLAPCVAGGVWPEGLGEAEGRIRWTVVNEAGARGLDDFCGRNFSDKAHVHIQIDTGLTRAGALPGEAVELAGRIGGMKHLKLEGMFAHLSHGDEAGHPTVERQAGVLLAAAGEVRREFPELMVHVQNSGGAWHLGEAGLSMARVGIGLYGLQPSAREPIAGLLPVGRLVAPILDIHERGAGVGVGYGHTFITCRASRLAVVPVGYGDGYPRLLSNRGVVQVGGRDVPVVGRVSMDQIVVDVTDAAGAKVGDEVTVFSDDAGAVNCMDKVAEMCGTIGYEVATGVGGRVARRGVG